MQSSFFLTERKLAAGPGEYAFHSDARCSDAAAAFVLCNSLGLGKEANPLFELVEWSTTAIPNSEKSMSFLADTGGRCFSEVASTVTDHRHRLSYYHNPRRCNPNHGSFGANVS